MFKYLKKIIVLMAVGGFPLLPYTQIEGCQFIIPPFFLNGIEVNHTLSENTNLTTDGVWGMFCPPSFQLIMNNQSMIELGYWQAPDGPIINPFTYSINFMKPVISLDFVLISGDLFLLDGELVQEDFNFESLCSNFTISLIFGCGASFDGNSIYLGEFNGSGKGHGVFNITFSEPIFEFKISGLGGGAGSGFSICSNSIIPAPFYASLSAPQQACSQDSVSFTTYIGGQEPHPAPYTFSYTVNGGAVQNISTTGINENVQVALPQTPGSYTYELLSVTDANGNSVNITCNNTQTVTVQQPPVAQFTTNPNSGFSPLSVTLTNQSTNATQYEWLLNNTPITPQNNTITLQDTGAYQITLIASNDLGCTDTAVQTVHVLEELQVTIPNVFTPNNDDVNEWFGFTANVEVEASLVILNRWGGVVFEKRFVTIVGDFMELWDGTSTGSVATPSSVPATDGVYFYKLVLSGEGWEEEFIGSVSLRK